MRWQDMSGEITGQACNATTRIPGGHMARTSRKAAEPAPESIRDATVSLIRESSRKEQRKRN
ncbi:hypothetical protein GCM10025759_11720 [Lysobacter panacisoli]|uniref:Uncharacterized protein n=1 Tax=Lysobacter panacisoli TaxID=1255263 RepID=A0ABP9L6H1_9GAMM